MTAYPTMEAVEAADTVALLRWLRYLPSPGTSGLGQVDNAQAFNQLMQEQSAILARITDRLSALGGITPEISKAVGWGEE